MLKIKKIGSQSEEDKSTHPFAVNNAAQEKGTSTSLAASNVTSTYSAEVEAPTRMHRGEFD